MAAARQPWAAEVLRVWFGILRPADWFSPREAVDWMLERRFRPDLERLANRPAATFLKGPDTARAAILLFDQMSRNIFRDTPRAFATDTLAIAVARGMIRRGWHKGLSDGAKQFVGMPFMHSERIADQRLGLAFFASEGLYNTLRFARSHHVMIARFGRFPHRNATLGRTTTAAEQRAIDTGFAW
ncbi:MAG: DUF924 family protein [Parerythrobacter sp.]